MDDFTPIPNNQEILKTLDGPPPVRRRINWTTLAIICILLGAGLFVAGWLSGSRGGRIYFDNGVNVVAYQRGERSWGETESTNITGRFTAISVEASSAAIEFVPTTANSPQVVAPNHFDVSYSQNGGNLSITITNTTNFTLIGGASWGRNGFSILDFNFSGNPFTSGSNTVRVYVPASVTDITARTSSGRIQLDGVSTNQLDLRASSGRLAVNGGNHRNTTLQTTSGSIRVEAHLLGNIEARASSGSININDLNTSHANRADNMQIHLRTSSGSIRFNTRLAYEDFLYGASVSSGSIRIDDGRIRGGRNIQGGTSGNGNATIIASASSGSIRLNFGQ